MDSLPLLSGGLALGERETVDDVRVVRVLEHDPLVLDVFSSIGTLSSGYPMTGKVRGGVRDGQKS